jgi:hypothetical protein
MNNKFDQKLFDEWLSLRKQLAEAKHSKNHENIIKLCLAILSLNDRAKFIKIMTPLFYKEIANSYLKLNDYANALHYLETARDDFIAYRQNNNLDNPDDWLKDINTLEKDIDKIISKISFE